MNNSDITLILTPITVNVLLTALVAVLTLHDLRLEGCIFLKKDTVSPMFGLFNRERENLRFHASIISYPLFIVKLWFWASRECPFSFWL